MSTGTSPPNAPLPTPPGVAEGDYARKQIYCPSRVVAWSHGSRFTLASRLAASAGAEQALLDYGCGDGTFLALTHGTFRRAVGADLDEPQLADCRRRLGALGLQFVHISLLADPEHTHAYGVVTCMEVLEHCHDDERRRVVGELARLVAPGGTVIVSVPIEIGPALLAKQFFRAVAAWRGHGDYQHRERYSPMEFLAAALGRRRLARAEYVVGTAAGPRRYCGHKGFDWRVLQRELASTFEIRSRLFTPMRPLGPLLNSQVWFVCRPR